MKKVKKILFTSLLSALAFSVFAQDYQDNYEGSLYDAVNKDKYGDNWFVSLGLNSNLLLGENDQFVPFFDRLKKSWGGQITAGKWFNATTGMRFQVMAGTMTGGQTTLFRGFFPHNYYVITGLGDGQQYHKTFPKGFYLNGGSDGTTDFQDPKYWVGFRTDTRPTGDGGQYVHGFYQDLTYANATIDFMINLTTLLRGHYVPDNKFDFIPFVGLGMVYGFPNDLFMNKFYSIDAKIGFRALYNLNDKWGIFLEPQANATTPEFDGYQGDTEVDAFLNLTLGVQYTFNKNIVPFEKLVSDEIDNLNKKVNENRYLIDQHQDILDRHEDLLDRLLKCCEEKQVVTQVIDNRKLPEYVRFVLDSYKIEVPEHRKIEDVVDFVNSKPEAKLLLIGYADRQTGNPRYNYALSQKRVEAVSNELKRLGVPADKIEIQWKGDREQPFSQNDWNRVVIIVER